MVTLYYVIVNLHEPTPTLSIRSLLKIPQPIILVLFWKSGEVFEN
jgi:hypothetical protein